MATNNLSFLLLLFFTLYNVSLVHGLSKISQGKYLNNIYKAKGVDTSNFKPYLHDHEDIKISNDAVESKDNDKIVSLPGQPQVAFDQYGGYITVNESAGRAFFYYFVEAEQNKESKPLLLWLNGGPGCSSLGFGALQEVGPFRVNSDGKTLYKNQFAWNQDANVLFVESPVGVGFSYSNTSDDYHLFGDQRTAADNYAFLLNWLNKFPEYKDRDFYISGESYSGHYIPQLAQIILQQNKAKQTFINLKGVIIGNAVINTETDGKGFYDFLGGHGIISYATLEQIHTICDFSPNATLNPKCLEALGLANVELSDIDTYNIYAPICKNFDLTATPKAASNEVDPCSEYYTQAYLNSPDVQQAFHANVTKLAYDWEPCSDHVVTWEDSPTTILPILQDLIANGLRVWFYSGDTDGRVTFTSTVYSLKLLNLNVKSIWHPWMDFDGQVGGYTEEYEGLTFATVRGAGHQAPSYQPGRALAVISNFLNGTPLPRPDDFPNSIITN